MILLQQNHGTNNNVVCYAIVGRDYVLVGSLDSAVVVAAIVEVTVVEWGTVLGVSLVVAGNLAVC